MSFEWPEALIALLVVPVLVVLYVVHERRRASFAARWGTPALLPNLVDRAPRALRHLPVAVLFVALAALVVGVARPHATVHVKREEATVLLVVDVSRSMGAKDVRPTRLAAAKKALEAFVARVPDKYRIGIVSVSSRAVVTLPPTADRTLIEPALDPLRPREGTALGDAVVLAATLGQRQRTSDGKVPPTSILIVSDGAPDGGRTTIQRAAARARALHVPVYSVVLGTANGVVEHKLTGGYVETIRVPAKPATLKQLASTTGGAVFTAQDDSGLRDVYEKLASRLGKKKESREMTDAFAGASAALLIVGGLLSAMLFRRVP
jgi:Ca-activated chloride channel family protein